MKTVEIKFKTAKMTDHIKVTYALPENTSEAVKKYSEPVVFSRFNSALTIDVQSVGRGVIDETKTLEENTKLCQEAVDKFVPGVKAVGKTDLEKAKAAFDKLSSEEREALFKLSVAAAAGGRK